MKTMKQRNTKPTLSQPKTQNKGAYKMRSLQQSVYLTSRFSNISEKPCYENIHACLLTQQINIQCVFTGNAVSFHCDQTIHCICYLKQENVHLTDKESHGQGKILVIICRLLNSFSIRSYLPPTQRYVLMNNGSLKTCAEKN